MLRFIQFDLQRRKQQVVLGGVASSQFTITSQVRCSTRFYFRYTFVCIVYKFINDMVPKKMILFCMLTIKNMEGNKKSLKINLFYRAILIIFCMVK